MTLYNAKTEPSGSLSITKFDSELNPESTYSTTRQSCTCPAGSRSTCRHRQMFPHLLAIADSSAFWDFETVDYVTPMESEES